MKKISKKYIYWFALPVIETISQILLKYSSLNGKEYIFENFKIKIDFHYFLSSIIFEIIGLILWLKILENYDLNTSFPLTSFTIVLIAFFGFYIFNEAISTQNIIGMVFIIIGILLLKKNNKN
jgi:multidrug transporter EmrE-like cation transporter